MGLKPRRSTTVGANGRSPLQHQANDEQIFLHYQERYLAQRGGSANVNKAFYLPTKADDFVFELHSWLKQYDAEPFPGETLAPPLTKEALLDRYHSHTIKCASCRTALKNLQRLRLGVGIATVLIWSLLPLLLLMQQQPSTITAIVLTVVVLVGAGAWFGLGKFEQRFYRGRDIPPRNLPEK